MDFFAGQERARRASRRLILLFAFALAASVSLVYLAVLPAIDREGWWQADIFLITLLSVGGTILIGSLIRIAALTTGGGAVVAQTLGGRRVERSTTDADERRLLNLVDEMAIASGVPVPQVFVLDETEGINAFAAGNRPADAAIAVTRGALRILTRDELQGVIAHEFSHILNGDMQLNLRLLGVLHGLFMLAGAGRLLLRNGGRADRARGVLIALGLSLIVAGWLGVLAGRLIRAAVSRQREFLADASAVQFTRNPQGIASALQRIASHGSDIAHPAAEEISHMLLDSGRLNRWLATHPPLAERIRRLGGDNLSPPTARRVSPTRPTSSAQPAEQATISASLEATLANAFVAEVGNPAATNLDAAQQLIRAIPTTWRNALETPDPEHGLLTLLLATDAATREKQIGQIKTQLGRPVAHEVLALPTPTPGQRLPLIELALPSLQAKPLRERERFVTLAEAIVCADGGVSLSEYIVVRLLRDALLPRPPAPALTLPGELDGHCAVLLSLFAHAGQHGHAVAAAFASGAVLAPGDRLTLSSVRELGADKLDQALAMLAATAPAYRRRLVMALYAVAGHDAQIVPREQELLRLVCTAIDCPLPAGDNIATPASAADTAGLVAVDGDAQATTDAALFADKTPLQALLLANLIPVFGVLFFDWDARNVLLLYWLENLVIGAYTLLRMLATHKWKALGTALFFSFHYSFFCGGHGMFILALAGLGSDGIDDPMKNLWPADDSLPFLIPIRMMLGILSWIAHTSPGMLGLPLLAFAVSHGISAFTHHVILREDDGRNTEQIMWDPYRRIVLLHIALIFGGFVIVLSGGGGAWPILLLLIGFKTALDIHQHRRSHAKRQDVRRAGLASGKGDGD